MLHYDSPYTSVQWDESAQCVIIQWKKFAQGDDFRKPLLAALELLKSKGGKKWLIDGLDMKAVAKEDKEWGEKVFHPQVMSAGVKFNAIIVPKDVMAKFSIKSTMEKATEDPITIRYFPDIEEAKEWLRTQ